MSTDSSKYGSSVAIKFAIISSLAALVFCAVAIVTSYSYMSVFLRDAAGNDQKKMAELMAASIEKASDERVALLAGTADKSSYEASLGDLVVDESTGLWSLPLNITVPAQAEKPASTRSTSLNVDVFYNPLKEFKIGDTGHAALVDSRTYLIFSPGVKPFSNKFSSYNELQKAFNERSGWFVMNGVYGHRGDVFVAFCALEYPLLVNKGIKWSIFVVRDAKDVFSPIKKLIKMELIAAFILVIVLGLVGFMLGRLLVRPVRMLNDALDRLGMGDFSCRINVNSKDELGGLAGCFNAMAESLGDKSTSKANLTKEIEARRKAEEKVKQLSQEWQKAFDSIKAAAASGVQPSGPGNVSESIKNVDKLMDATKIETEKIELNLKPIDVRELMKSAVFKFEPKIREKNLALKLDLPKGALPVSADPEKVDRVMAILINNALRFTEKGYIAISVKETNTDVRCSIIDTGKAIAPEYMSKIFEDLHNLNLSISRAIIEKHGGKIWVEQDPNKLTKITFSLPLSKK